MTITPTAGTLWQQPDPPRGGATFDQARDGKRLNAQHQIVLALMVNGDWFTLRRISELTGFPEASVSARLRDFRKAEHGGMKVDRRHVAGGLFEYRVEKFSKQGS